MVCFATLSNEVGQIPDEVKSKVMSLGKDNLPISERIVAEVLDMTAAQLSNQQDQKDPPHAVKA